RRAPGKREELSSLGARQAYRKPTYELGIDRRSGLLAVSRDRAGSRLPWRHAAPRLSKAEACFRLLVVPLELAQPCGAGGLLSVGLCSVQLVALAGVISLRSQIVQVFDRHALAVFRGSCAPLGAP